MIISAAVICCLMTAFCGCGHDILIEDSGPKLPEPIVEDNNAYKLEYFSFSTGEGLTEKKIDNICDFIDEKTDTLIAVGDMSNTYTPELFLADMLEEYGGEGEFIEAPRYKTAVHTYFTDDESKIAIAAYVLAEDQFMYVDAYCNKTDSEHIIEQVTQIALSANYISDFHLPTSEQTYKNEYIKLKYAPKTYIASESGSAVRFGYCAKDRKIEDSFSLEVAWTPSDERSAEEWADIYKKHTKDRHNEDFKDCDALVLEYEDEDLYHNNASYKVLILEKKGHTIRIECRVPTGDKECIADMDELLGNLQIK